VVDNTTKRAHGGAAGEPGPNTIKAGSIKWVNDNQRAGERERRMTRGWSAGIQRNCGGVIPSRSIARKLEVEHNIVSHFRRPKQTGYPGGRVQGLVSVP
jgi:hypothetical protein